MLYGLVPVHAQIYDTEQTHVQKQLISKIIIIAIIENHFWSVCEIKKIPKKFFEENELQYNWLYTVSKEELA